MNTPSLKSLALAASSARKALDAGAYSSSGRELAQAEIRAFDSAATPERILELTARIEALEEALKPFAENSHAPLSVTYTVGDLRCAARAYANKGEPT